jgi:hypothetical protein
VFIVFRTHSYLCFHGSSVLIVLCLIKHGYNFYTRVIAHKLPVPEKQIQLDMYFTFSHSPLSCTSPLGTPSCHKYARINIRLFSKLQHIGAPTFEERNRIIAAGIMHTNEMPGWIFPHIPMHAQTTRLPYCSDAG